MSAPPATTVTPSRPPSLAAVAEVLHPITWFPPMWAFACGMVASGVPFEGRWWLVAVGVILAGPLACGTSQVINDWFDRHVDAINEPDRPIPSGRIAGRWGLYLSIAFSVLTLLVAAFLGPWVFGATALGVVLAWAYSAPPVRLKRNGWWGNTAVGFTYEGLAWVTGSALMLGGAMPSWQSLTLAALYSIGAHGIMTLNDFKSVEGDRRLGLRSLPVQLGVARAAQLAEDSLVEIIGRQFAFARDETLPIALIAGRAKDNVPDGSLAFCGRPNADLAKNMLAASTLGITSLFNRTSGTPRVCFFDEEKDNMADMAVLVGVKSDADAVPVKIEPLRYTIVELQPMSGESQIRITYRGKTGLVGGHVSFDLAVMEQGTALCFDNWRRKIDIADLPQDVSMFGANFTVHSYDRESGEVEVTIRRGIQSGPYGITSVPTTRTIPIFIPG